MNASQDTIFGGSFLVAPLGSQPQFIPEELSDDAKAVGQAAREFVEGEIIPNDAAIDKLDLELSRELLGKAGELGLLSLEIPEAFEGMDLDKLTGLLVLEELGRQASFSVSYGAHTGIGTLPIVYFGNEEQKAKYLPKLGSGEWLAAYALTEPGAGSDAMNAKTVATLDGDTWVLNGSKMWITNAGFADVFVVFAKVDGRKFSAFIVEKNDPGFSVAAEEHKLGIKGSSTRALTFENCRIPKDRLLGEVGKGHRIAFGILAIGRFKLGAGCNGIAKEVLKYTLKYTGERQQFGKSINTFGLIRKYLADMGVRIFVAESMNFRTLGYINDGMHAASWDQPDAAKQKMEIMDEFQMEASIMKVWDSEALGFIADDAVQCFGGYGFSAEYPPEKIYRDNRINRLFEGTNEINRMIIANQVFKKVGNGTLAFRKDAGDLPAFDGPLGRAKTAVERAKRMLQFAVASALEVTGQKLIENQEASARAADMAMEIYTMESAVVRADKLAASGDRWADFARDCAEVFANEGAPKVAAHARLFLAEVLEGEALDAALAALDAIALPAPVAGSVRRGRIADLLIEKGAYPIDLF
ncbi:MAG: putative acyl-CoA dehydrogenase [Acidobacteria bacterium ADurb.Bin340]|nr:MAG: putative acyl-CoA dehydrogenase [Acidobacteria bacterium ADurb.Bin340]HQL47893.1 acyl-CoA dehydrogenase family protein [Holophaga sp.]